MSNATFTIPQAKLNTAGVITLDVSMSRREIDPTNLISLTNPSFDRIFLPRTLWSTNATGLALEFMFMNNAEDLVHYANDKKSYVRIYLPSIVTGATATGLANDATKYEFTIVIKGTEYAFSVAGSSLQTYTALISQINTVLSTNGTASLKTLINETSHIEILLTDFGLIRVVDGIVGSADLDLFATLTATIQAPFHNRFDWMPFANNTQINDNENRHIYYMLIKTPGGAASAALNIYCKEYIS